MAYFQLAYPWGAAHRVLEIFQDLAAHAPDELMVICKLGTPARPPGAPDPSPAVRDPRLAGEGALQLDAFGGALNRVAPDATAFVHRASLMHGQFLAYWTAGDPVDVVEANLEWIEGFYAGMRPFWSGAAYQNYIDPDLADRPRAYYGDNLPRLAEVKRRYDPDGVFRFAHSIPRGRDAWSATSR